jgi:O6-methylguanine-DNA--protein-cysteine methyltransferase
MNDSSLHPLTLASGLIATPLGEMLAVAGDEGIVLLDFQTRHNFDGEVQRLKGRLALHGQCATIAPGRRPHLELLRAEVAEYFAGDRRDFTVPVAPQGTDFELQAWRFLQTIPYGQTRSYGSRPRHWERPALPGRSAAPTARISSGSSSPVTASSAQVGP